MAKDKARSEAAKAGWAKRKRLNASYGGYAALCPTLEQLYGPGPELENAKKAEAQWAKDRKEGRIT